MDTFGNYLKIYLQNRPLFLALIRAKELELYQRYFTQVQLGSKSVRKPKSPGLTLDFGCGDGFFLKILTETDKKRMETDIVGLEVDRKKAEEARRAGVYRQVVLYDGKKIPFADNYFETVVSNCVLEHVGSESASQRVSESASQRVSESARNSRLIEVLRDINRVLKPGGRFYCTVMTNKWEEYLFGNLLLGSFYKKWMRKIQKHSNLLTANEWKKAFRKAEFRFDKILGYLDKRASRWIDVLHYISLGSLISYKLRGDWPFLPKLYDFLPIERWLSGLVKQDIAIEKAAALFFALEK